MRTVPLSTSCVSAGTTSPLNWFPGNPMITYSTGPMATSTLLFDPVVPLPRHTRTTTGATILVPPRRTSREAVAFHHDPGAGRAQLASNSDGDGEGSGARSAATTATAARGSASSSGL